MSKPISPIEIAEAIQRIYIGLTVENASRYIAEDCVVHEAPSLPFGGDWKGPQGFVDLMRAIQTTFRNFRFEPGSMVSDDARLAFFGRISGDTPNGRFDIPFAEYWTCRDGKVIEAWPMWQDTKKVMDLYHGAAKT
jgi:uncharacterized protein